MPVLSRRQDKVRQMIEKLKWCEFDDVVGPCPRGLPPTTPPDPVGGPGDDSVPGQHVADAGDPAVWAADPGRVAQVRTGPGRSIAGGVRDSAGRRTLLDQQPAQRRRRSLESRGWTWGLSAAPKRWRVRCHRAVGGQMPRPLQEKATALGLCRPAVQPQQRLRLLATAASLR